MSAPRNESEGGRGGRRRREKTTSTTRKKEKEKEKGEDKDEEKEEAPCGFSHVFASGESSSAMARGADGTGVALQDRIATREYTLSWHGGGILGLASGSV